MNGQSMLEDLSLQIDSAHIGLHNGDLVLDINIDDLVHALHVEDDHPISGGGANGMKSRRQWLGHEMGLVAEAHDLLDLLRGLRHNHGDGTRQPGRAVGHHGLRIHVERVGIHHAGSRGHPLLANDVLKCFGLVFRDHNATFFISTVSAGK